MNRRKKIYTDKNAGKSVFAKYWKEVKYSSTE
jgi:hypothetical protein